MLTNIPEPDNVRLDLPFDLADIFTGPEWAAWREADRALGNPPLPGDARPTPEPTGTPVSPTLSTKAAEFTEQLRPQLERLIDERVRAILATELPEAILYLTKKKVNERRKRKGSRK